MRSTLYWLVVRSAVALRNFSHGSTIRAAAISRPRRISCSREAKALCCFSSRATTPAMARDNSRYNDYCQEEYIVICHGHIRMIRSGGKLTVDGDIARQPESSNSSRDRPGRPFDIQSVAVRRTSVGALRRARGDRHPVRRRAADCGTTGQWSLRRRDIHGRD